jgi:1-phosphatidylinositol phosphodiesterase
LFWSFASSEHNVDIPSERPEIMAIGNGSTPLGGVNHRLESFFGQLKGKRLRIVMFGSFGTLGDLINTFLAI